MASWRRSPSSQCSPGKAGLPGTGREASKHRSRKRLGKWEKGTCGRLGTRWGPGRCPCGPRQPRPESTVTPPRARLARGLSAARVLPPASSFSPCFRKRGARLTAPILKGEIISLLPVLGKTIRSQKCLLVTPFVERHFGIAGWKNWLSTSWFVSGAPPAVPPGSFLRSRLGGRPVGARGEAGLLRRCACCLGGSGAGLRGIPTYSNMPSCALVPPGVAEPQEKAPRSLLILIESQKHL